jgi:hypothetical protein
LTYLETISKGERKGGICKNDLALLVKEKVDVKHVTYSYNVSRHIGSIELREVTRIVELVVMWLGIITDVCEVFLPVMTHKHRHNKADKGRARLFDILCKGSLTTCSDSPNL